VLVTDTLFIGTDEEKALTDAGYDIERLDKPQATEAELVEAIRGKDGYILGGIETVTEAVIDAADTLRAIAFTGSGYAEFIPAWETATRKGIAISAAAGQNAGSVAEWSLVTGLTLSRNITALSTTGGPSFFIGREFGSLTLGIVGFGNIGRELASRARALGVRVIATASASSPSGDPEVETVTLDDLVLRADIVSVHVSKDRGAGVLDERAISRIRSGGIVVNAAFEHAIDNDSLLRRVRTGELRAALDYPVVDRSDVPPGALIASNAQTAFNTAEANARISARATHSLLNLLQHGEDDDLVNPGFREQQRSTH
jgi:phosphoglycerate dehydrogenase-like enzyme